mgnify:FL=1
MAFCLMIYNINTNYGTRRMAEKEKLQVIEVYIQASIQSEINTSPWRHNVFFLMRG